ncbi:MAG TPA: glycine/sarcosine/betaine reductase selenoprotein B family protein [Pelovirga sp.]|nr:glycine/sarcosine/betaine reductase selenoprotein B family protein [Pelovirga sp.]
MQFSRLKNQLLARLATRFPALAKKFTDSYTPRANSGDIPWVRPAVPLPQAKLALVTTAGIHHPEQRPFDMNDPNGDPSYRAVDGNRLFADFTITHDYYDHSDADKDPNIILPLDRMQEMVGEKKLGSLAATHYSFMGHIVGPHIDTLTHCTAVEVARKLLQDEVDIVLLTPG